MAKATFGGAPPQDPNSLDGYTGSVSTTDRGLFGSRNRPASRNNVGAGNPFRDIKDRRERNIVTPSKPISQNPERYSKVGTQWIISANGDSPNKAVTPITLPIGVPLTNLKPLILANGIIVKVGENYLCSLTTLNEIKNSNNPHYDIVQNGTLKVKDKDVVMGKTIKIIELNLTNLTTIMDERDTLNKNAGVVDVVYGPETGLVDGVPKGILDQINYTLNETSSRPMDEYSIFDFYSMVDFKLNPKAGHYKITPLLVQTQQEDTVFEPAKLREYLTEVGNKLKLLEKDFNFIQDIFYEAIIPSGPMTYTDVTEAKSDVETNKHHTVRRYSRNNGSFEDNSLNKTKTELEDSLEQSKQELKDSINEIKNELELTEVTKPTVEKWKLRRKRDGDKNGMGIYPTANFKNFGIGYTKKADKKQGSIKEGETFTGYLFKSQKFKKVTLNIWAIQSTPDATPTGYAYQGRGDDIDKA